MLKRIIITILLTSWWLWSAESLSLQQALNEGLTNNMNIIKVKNTIQKSENNRVLATTSLMPTVSANASYNYSWTNDLIEKPSVGGSPSGDFDGSQINAAIQAQWILFDGLRMFKAYDLVHKQADLGSLTIKQQKEVMALQIMAAYMNIALQRKVLETQQTVTEVSKQRYEKAKLKHEMGLLVQRELLNSQVALNKDSAELINQENKLIESKRNLSSLLGREIHNDFLVDTTVLKLPAEPIPTADKITEDCLANNVEIQSLKEQIKLADLNLGIKKAAYWPMLIGSASYGYSNNLNHFSTADVETEATQAKVGLALTWTLFNGLNDKVSVQNTRLDKRNAQIDEKQKVMTLKVKIADARDKLTKALQQYKFDLNTEELSLKNLELSKEYFELGRITDLQFREAQLGWRSSVLKRFGTIVNAQLLWLELQQVSGRLNF